MFHDHRHVHEISMSKVHGVAYGTCLWKVHGSHGILMDLGGHSAYSLYPHAPRRGCFWSGLMLLLWLLLSGSG